MNGHLWGYIRPSLSGNKHLKYTNITKPLFTTIGLGLRDVTRNKIYYGYLDDPNKLVNRLRLLVLSKYTGNTGMGNEIDLIIEKLRVGGNIC